jgi:hypothetical protein
MQLRGLRDQLEQGMANVQQARKDANARVLTLLTPEQRAAWTELQGPVFQGEISLPGMVGGGRLGR